MAGLTLKGVTKTFAGFNALKDVTLDAANNEFLAVLGPSGCGKTTLLRMVAGFETPTAGTIAIDGLPVCGPAGSVPPEKRNVGIVFQNYALWPHMTVAENIGYALRVKKTPANESRKRVEDALALVNLNDYGERYPANLSGGQRQRVALARCLVSTPTLVLFDEPLANLDVHLRASMQEEFTDFHKRTGTTIVYITHDQAEAMAMADRIAVMDHGRLVQIDAPRTLYREPATQMVASFIAQGIVLPARVIGNEADGHCRVDVLGQEILVRCRPAEQPRANAMICCRAPDIEPGQTGEPGIDGRVRRVVYKGGVTRIDFVPAADPHVDLHFEQPDPNPFTAGSAIRIRIKSGWLIPEKTVP